MILTQLPDLPPRLETPWWAQSDDEGRTWTTAFDGRYVRRP